MYLYNIPTVLSLLYFSFCLCFHFVSVLGHSLFFSTCSHLSTFRCKGSTARKHGKHQFPIDNKFFKTLRNQIDCGFLKKLSINYLPYFPFHQYSYLAHKRFEMTVTPEKKSSGRRSKNLLRLRIRMPEIIIKLQKQQEYGKSF